MRLELLPAPEQMVTETGDPKALCCEFQLGMACGHVEPCRVWVPIGALTQSRHLEEVVTQGADRLRVKALTNHCRVCSRLLAS